jgi:hypothetical protein
MTLCQQQGSADFMRFELRGASFEHEPRTLSEMKVRAALLIAAAGRSEVTREPLPAAGRLEIDLQGSIERELKGLVLFLTHRVLTSGASSAR